MKAPKGYKLSDKEYNVTITSNNTPLRLIVTDEVIMTILLAFLYVLVLIESFNNPGEHCLCVYI